MDIGLCLSGGGAKGAAHIGVLKALEEENIQIKYISGCSSGSIVASLYFAGYTPNEILNFFNLYGRYIKDYDKNLFFKFLKGFLFCNLQVKGIIKGNNLENLMRRKLYKKGIKNILDYNKKIAIPAVDIRKNKLCYFVNKKIEESDCEYIQNIDAAKAVRASCSFPGIFLPVYYKDKIFVDGGVIDNTPIDILKKMGAKKVIAVTFAEDENVNKVDNFLDVLVESFESQSKEIRKMKNKGADCLITLKLPKVSLLDVEKSNYIAKRGYELIKENMDKIIKIINS